MAYCTKCGSKTKEGAKFCGSCGKDMADSAEKTTDDKTKSSKSPMYECEYCGKGFNSELAVLKHEKSCNRGGFENRYEQPIASEEHYGSKRPAMNFNWVIIVIIIVIALIIIMNMYNQSAYDRTAVGQIKSIFR